MNSLLHCRTLVEDQRVARVRFHVSGFQECGKRLSAPIPESRHNDRATGARPCAPTSS